MKLRLEPKLQTAVSHFVAEITKLIDAYGLEKPQADGYYSDAQRSILDEDFRLISEKLHKGNALHLGQTDYPNNALYAMYNCYHVLEQMCSEYSASTIATLLPRLYKMRPQIELMLRDFTYLSHATMSADPFHSMWVVDEKTRKLAVLYQAMFTELKTIENPDRIINPTALKLILKAVEFEDELDFSGDKELLEMFGYEALSNMVRFYDCIEQYRAIYALHSNGDPATDSFSFLRESEYDRWSTMHDLENRIKALYGLSETTDLASSRALLIQEQATHFIEQVKAYNGLAQDDGSRHECAIELYQKVMRFEKALHAFEKTVNIEHSTQITSDRSDELHSLRENIVLAYNYGDLPILTTLGSDFPDRLSAKQYLLSKINLLSGTLLTQIQQDLRECTGPLKHYADEHDIKIVEQDDEISSQTLDESIDVQAQLIDQKNVNEQNLQKNQDALVEHKRQLAKFSKPDFATRRAHKKQMRQDTVRMCERNIAELTLQQEKLKGKLAELNKQIAGYTNRIKNKSDQQLQARQLDKRIHFAHAIKTQLSSYKVNRHKRYAALDLLQKIFSFGKATQRQLRETYVDQLMQCLDHYAQTGERQELSVKLQTGLTMFKPRHKHENSLTHIIDDINQRAP